MKLEFTKLGVLLFGILVFSSCNPSGKGLNAGGSILLVGEFTGEQFGKSLDFTGDINDDGYEDVAVGAPQNSLRGDNSGMVYIFFGPFDVNSDSRDPDMRIAGQPGTGFGKSLAGNFDVNSDLKPDLIVSSAKSAFGSTENGDVFIYFGGKDIFQASDDAVDGFGAADIIITGNDNPSGFLLSKSFGQRVEKIGDFDRDGIDDLGVSAPQSAYNGASNSGALFVFLSGRSLGSAGQLNASLADYIFAGIDPGGEFAASFDYALNLDAQGEGAVKFRDDFLAGSPGSSKAHVFLGPASLYSPGIVTAERASKTFVGEAADTDFGRCVSHLSDYDSDGIDDLVISSKDSVSDKVYLYNGRAQEPPLDQYSILIKGESLALNGPSITALQRGGIGDVVVGAPLGGLSGFTGGAVFVFASERLTDFPVLGMTMLSILESGKIINNPVPLGDSSEFGSSLSGDGDINSDGMSDLLIGAPKGRMNGVDSGFALLIF